MHVITIDLKGGPGFKKNSKERYMGRCEGIKGKGVMWQQYFNLKVKEHKIKVQTTEIT